MSRKANLRIDSQAGSRAKKILTCSSCLQEITKESSEYYVKKDDKNREEYYHPACARLRKIRLPIEIRFTNKNVTNSEKVKE